MHHKALHNLKVHGTDNGRVRVDNKDKVCLYDTLGGQGRENQGERAFSGEAPPVYPEVRAMDPTVAYSDPSHDSIFETGKPLCIFAKD